MLEYTKLVVSILLIGIFFILFGLERIQMLKDKGVVISRFEETPSQFPSPGHIVKPWPQTLKPKTKTKGPWADTKILWATTSIQ